MIANADSLAAVLPALAAERRIAIDTEADSLHCYFEKLCLIQISIPGSDLLVDPLADFSLDPLFRVLEPRELILHGADYDLRLLRRVGLREVTKIFDTMIAARLVGLTEFSLAALLQKFYDVTLAKSSQKANWAMRPLSPRMAEYAQNDTRYLLALAQELEFRLLELGRWEWFTQSCERAIAASTVIRERDEENAWRISGNAECKERAAAILRALWRWRDAEAQAADKPAFHILHNELLIEAALRFDQGQPPEIRHLRGPRLHRFYQAAEEAMRLPEEEWPQPIRRPRSRPTPREQQRFNELRTRRDRAAEEHNLDPSIIAPKATLEALAAEAPGSAERLMPWQSELLGLQDLARR